MDEKRRSGERDSHQFNKKGGYHRPGGGFRSGGGFRGGGRRELSNTTAEDVAEYIMRVLARDPQLLRVERQQDNRGRSRLTVTCDPAVTGRLIGKGGKTISALRLLVKSIATRYGKRVDIEVT